ncbi:hypothetical protein EFE42_00960 [Methanohalophilus sp. RSK]|uniref:C39 family peptidase n=1 Tax=Methanohalophilus sp. RSK TaxID=2485783 RepID=UPI000F43E0BF|nr:C39 family peptidase [Methanohalophilus sp. RSK]RNI15839.1 hypothetical protein EFE42_00960 [Methanohalophilus sp. RSK]
MGKLNLKNMCTISTIVAFGLFIVCLSPSVSAMSDNSNVVTLNNAEEVAAYYVQYVPVFMPSMSDWEDATVKYSTTFYDIDGNKSAFSFDVIDNGEYAGYILVSATRDNYPILEFSEGSIPNDVAEFQSKSMVQASEYAVENNLRICKAKPLYLGGTFYYIEYSLIDSSGNVSDKVVVDLITSQSISPAKLSNFSSVNTNSVDFNNELLQQNKVEAANELWNSLENRMDSGNLTPDAMKSSRGLGWVDDVPAYEWYRGCSPTASAMVLGYWDTQGYPDFTNNETLLIDELADAMNTGSGGNTSMSNIPIGIEDVCEDYGYNDFESSNEYYVTWSETKSEIDGDRPFVLSVFDGGVGSGHSKPYNNHSVTCIGYSDYTEDYVFIHDTWDENTHHIAFDNWDRAHATWVIP